MTHTIAFLGGGNMARALVGGMLAADFPADVLVVVDPNADARAAIAALGVRSEATVDAVPSGVAAWVLAVKPQQMRAALAPLAARSESALIISIAAGLRIADLERWLGITPGGGQLVRAMPNTPALIGRGVTGLCAGPAVTGDARALAARVLGSVGEVVWVGVEHDLDAVTAVSGSGPAYVFHFLEALEAAGVANGLSAEAARALAVGTLTGAAELAAQSPDDFAVLRERVTSRGGTTEAALATLARHGWHDALVAAVGAATARSVELGADLGRDQ